MSLKSINAIIILPALCACAGSPQTIDPPSNANWAPTREESVSFFSRIHKTVRDSERASYDLMYDIRDGFDSFVYDVQKGYYQGYQK
jgi:hypothetical protein